MEIVSESLFNMHDQIKCLPFSGGGILLEARLVSDESERLLSAVKELPGGKTAATKSLLGEKDIEKVSMIAATSVGHEDFAFV